MVNHKKVTIWPDPKENIKRALIEKIFEKWEKQGKGKGKNKGKDIYVSEFSRFGKSGAKLLLVYFFTKEPRGSPFLIKISINSKHNLSAQRAYDAAKSMYLEHGIRDCQPPLDDIVRYKGWGAVLYPNLGTDVADNAANNPLTFRQIMYYPYDKFFDEKSSSNVPQKLSKKEMQECLSTVFDKLGKAHTNKTKCKKINVKRHYKEYFKVDKATKRIRMVLGQNYKKTKIAIGKKRISNPLIVHKQLPESTYVQIGNIHGDLHPDNIVLDKKLYPHLIDFSTKKPLDILIDFVFLENSIRFWYFPHVANLEEQAAIDKWLLKKTGWRDIKKLKHLNDTAKKLYTRLAWMIEAIRKKAHQVIKKAGGKFNMQNYLLTQFIVLYYLMKYDSYDSYITTQALGLIGNKLKKKPQHK